MTPTQLRSRIDNYLALPDDATALARDIAATLDQAFHLSRRRRPLDLSLPRRIARARNAANYLADMTCDDIERARGIAAEVAVEVAALFRDIVPEGAGLDLGTISVERAKQVAAGAATVDEIAASVATVILGYSALAEVDPN